MDTPFNTWRFWLSSAVFFAGILAVGLLVGCATGEDPPSHLGFTQFVCHQYGCGPIDGDVGVLPEETLETTS